MNLELFLALRYLRSKRRHPFVGVVSWISVVGIAVGVAALIATLAVMNGFDQDLKGRIIGLRAHLVVEGPGGIADWRSLAARVQTDREVVAAAPFIEGQALIESRGFASGVLVRGVDPEAERRVSRFHQSLTEGTLQQRPGSAVVGAELAKRAGLVVGSSFRVATQETDKPFGAVVDGIFSSGMYDYDANLIFLNESAARRLFPSSGSAGLSVAVRDAERAQAVKKRLMDLLGPGHFVRSWMDLNRTFFSALKLEKIVMFVILALIILVASLNIAGSLTVLVIDKTRDIGVLKAIGMESGRVARVFALDGLMLGVSGAGAGLVLGLALCGVLARFRIVDLPKDIYYIDRLPVQVNPLDVLWVVGVAVALSFLSALYPAAMAVRLDPVRALRNE